MTSMNKLHHIGYVANSDKEDILLAFPGKQAIFPHPIVG
jgi:hypothetical protein